MTLTGLSGVYPILATPFRADRSVDEDDLAHLIDFIVASGADGIVFPGVASEFETLESAERTRLVDSVAHCVAARVPLVVGVSAADGRMPPRTRRQAQAVGAAAVMAVAPSAFAPGQKAAIRDYYARIAEVGVPVILQNAPPPAGCALSAEDVIELVRTIDGIRYVKEETLPCGQRITQILARAAAGTRRRVRRRGRPLHHRRARARRVRDDAGVRAHRPARAPVRIAPGRRCAMAYGSSITGCCRCSISRRCSAWR